MKSLGSMPCGPLLLILVLLSNAASAQFRDDFESVRVDPAGVKGWLFRPGDGLAVMDFRQGGDGYASIFVDATRDKRGIWWALLERKVSASLDLTSLQKPGMRLRIETRLRVSHAPRRVNLQLFTQRTTDYHRHLMEFDLDQANEWQVISWTPADLDVRPGDQVTAHMALMDWGPELYRVDLDYIKVEAVDGAVAGTDSGSLVPYHPPVPDPGTFSQRVRAAQDCTIDLENAEVNLNNWCVRAGVRPVRLLAVGGSQYAILRWDLSAFAGRRAAGHGLLEVTTRSVERAAEDIKDFGIVRVVEIHGGDPAWDQGTVTAQSLCGGEPLTRVLNTQPIIDWPVAEGDRAKTYFTISKPVLQRLIDGKTQGIALKPLGAIHASFYALEEGGGEYGAKLLFDVEGEKRVAREPRSAAEPQVKLQFNRQTR